MAMAMAMALAAVVVNLKQPAKFSSNYHEVKRCSTDLSERSQIYSAISLYLSPTRSFSYIVNLITLSQSFGRGKLKGKESCSRSDKRVCVCVCVG